MTDAPERLWAWCFNTPEHGGWNSWGGYARREPRHPLDDRERRTGAEYIRADATFTADDLRRAFAIAIEMAGDTAKSIRLDYDVMKPDQITYEPMRVQRAAKGMVRVAEDDIRAITPPDDLAALVKEGRDA